MSAVLPSRWNRVRSASPRRQSRCGQQGRRDRRSAAVANRSTIASSAAGSSAFITCTSANARLSSRHSAGGSPNEGRRPSGTRWWFPEASTPRRNGKRSGDRVHGAAVPWHWPCDSGTRRRGSGHPRGSGRHRRRTPCPGRARSTSSSAFDSSSPLASWRSAKAASRRTVASPGLSSVRSAGSGVMHQELPGGPRRLRG